MSSVDKSFSVLCCKDANSAHEVTVTTSNGVVACSNSGSGNSPSAKEEGVNGGDEPPDDNNIQPSQPFGSLMAVWKRPKSESVSLPGLCV